MIDFRQTVKYRLFLKKLGWKVIDSKVQKEFHALIRPIPFTKFSIIQFHRSKNLPSIKEIEKISKKYNALKVRIEFGIDVQKEAEIEKKLSKYGFKKIDWAIYPPRTQIINLSDSLTKIYDKFEQKVRYCIRNAQKKDIQIKIFTTKIPKSHINEKNDFYKFYKKNSQRLKISYLPKNSINTANDIFREDCVYCLAYINKKIVAGSIFFCSKDSICYTYSASNSEGKKSCAPSLIIWKTIIYSKKRNLNYFDFDGIYDPKHPLLTNSWKGFSNFKKGFNGNDKCFVSSFEKFIPYKRSIWEKIIIKYWFTRRVPSIYPCHP